MGPGTSLDTFFPLPRNIPWFLSCLACSCVHITVNNSTHLHHNVSGTYVHPRIMPGFYYRVRPAGSKQLLFEGRSLLLMSIGPGYGKRITFMPDRQSLNASNNFLWSDSHPDGLGFEPRAVHAGMQFVVTAAGQRLGEGSVFRADAVQQEERQELVCKFVIITSKMKILVICQDWNPGLNKPHGPACCDN